MKEKNFITAANQIKGSGGALAQEIINFYNKYYYPKDANFSRPSLQNIYTAYQKHCGFSAESATDFNTFWNKDFAAVINHLFGEKTDYLRNICAIITESPYAHTTYRPSYRSHKAGDYCHEIFYAIIHFIKFTCNEKTEIELIKTLNYFNHCSEYIALVLRGKLSNTQEIQQLINDTVQGENTSLSYHIIRGVIKSGVPEYLEKLGKLLLAAKNQEGVRQVILENADCGGINAHLYLIKLCGEHNLTRFSSVIRAFNTWTGLNYDNSKPAVIKKYFALAQKCLSEESTEGLESDDVTQIYMVLWAMACRDIHMASDHAHKLLNSQEKYKRLVGWYFIHSAIHEKTAHQTAMQYIHTRDPEELAWICTCLYTNSQAAYGYRYNQNNKQTPYPTTALPDCAATRKEQFAKLLEAIEFIGNKKTKFDGSIFPWTVITLRAEEAARCLLGLAGYDCDKDLIAALAKAVPLMPPDARMAYYSNLLVPENPIHRQILLNGLSDKSVHTKEAIAAILGTQKLTKTDIAFLTKTLSSKSANLRMAVTNILESQNALPTQSTAKTEEFTTENGFGLYDPKSPAFNPITWKAKRKIKLCTKAELIKHLSPTLSIKNTLLSKINDLIQKNEKMECETTDYNGSRQMVILGSSEYRLPTLPHVKNGHTRGKISDYYLGAEILQIVKDSAVSAVEIAKFICYKDIQFSFRYSQNNIKALEEIFNKLPPHKDFDLGKYGDIIYYALRTVLSEYNDGLFDFALQMWASLANLVPADLILTERKHNNAVYSPYVTNTICAFDVPIIAAWRTKARESIQSDEHYIAYFNESWYQYLLTDKKYHMMGISELLRAKKLNAACDNMIYHELLVGAQAHNNMRTLTLEYPDKNELFKTEDVKTYKDNAINCIINVEKNRDEMQTPLSHVAGGIWHFTADTDLFASLLESLGKENFESGYIYSITKKAVLSHLIRVCAPSKEAQHQPLKKIPQKRLLQAAMYAPQWAELAETATGIKGLSSAVWLFHAHVNERFNAEKETKISLYSPISAQRFADGTFDKDWFLQSYNTVGEKVFGELYKNAKYITTSNIKHRRSQLYADAALGRLNAAETEKEITEKRNQEKLRAYALIPLKTPEEAAHRYKFIQQYLKESKKFGSQRKASEGLAAAIALENLALTAGFEDASRMMWYFESERVPETPKELKEQQRRARQSLENAMVSRLPFSAEEIKRIVKHPNLTEILSPLVLLNSNNKAGFPILQNGKLYLQQPDGNKHKATDNLIIAHPADFKDNWQEYRQYLFANKTVQPFKQIFREFYPLTDDEKFEKTISRRYAGHQIQPTKAAAVLKTRGWTTNNYEGLQRVWHKENLIAKMYAMADWFSPSEVEAPTLETIHFFTRDKHEPVSLEEIPPIIFSETMRDIDLCVSVAHVGGVDPEASHSTVEMRVAIAAELSAMLKVQNIEFKKAHALIQGSMGEYTVHMGSGVVHKIGAGMVAVLPVHSQARGRIFLPFADNDPKTAEIMAKILLFADDKKIKDPSILAQLKHGQTQP